MARWIAPEALEPFSKGNPGCPESQGVGALSAVNQYLHHKSDPYRNAVRRKIAAYHRHIQLGLIAQGLLQILSATMPKSVWRSFGSWIRTIRPRLAPSEQVAAIAMRNTLPEFLASAAKTAIFVKFIRDRLDLSRAEGTRLTA